MIIYMVLDLQGLYQTLDTYKDSNHLASYS